MVYIVLPSFQPSPETTIALGGDDTSIDFTGDLQVDKIRDKLSTLNKVNIYIYMVCNLRLGIVGNDD